LEHAIQAVAPDFALYFPPGHCNLHVGVSELFAGRRKNNNKACEENTGKLYAYHARVGMEANMHAPRSILSQLASDSNH
jgi:hypothetical protein